jgi:putative acetyltransferase
MTTASGPSPDRDSAPTGSPLERAEAASLPTIRPETPDDIDAIAELHRAAFGRADEAALVDAVRRSAHFIGDLSLVAELNGQVVGHALLSRADLAPAEGGDPVPLLALAPIAILPLHQGRGIGTLLMRAAIALADARASEAAIVVLGPPSLYERFGFEPAASWDVGGPWEGAADAFQLRPVAGRTPTAGTVVYPPAFSLV